MELVDTFTRLWVLIIIIFGLVEVRAIFRKEKGDTFSEHVWKWADVTDDNGKVRKTYTFRRILLILGFVWMLVHFGWGL